MCFVEGGKRLLGERPDLATYIDEDLKDFDEEGPQNIR